MRKLLVLIGLLMITSIGFAQTQPVTTTAQSTQQSASSSQLQAKSSSKSVDLGFVQVASLGEVKAIPGQANQYELILEGVSPYLTYFTRRPGSVSGLALVQDFLKAWPIGEDSFAVSPPNGVLYAGEINGEPNTANKFYIVKLSNPRYSEKRNIMIYTVEPLLNQKFVLNELLMKQVALVIH